MRCRGATCRCEGISLQHDQRIRDGQARTIGVQDHSTRALGDAWIARKDSLLLGVPSVIVPEEHILLMNPKHPDAARLKIGRPIALNVDPRFRRKP